MAGKIAEAEVETIVSHEPQIFLTENAAKKLHELFVNEGDPNLKLRIFIEGGGCSGFKYEFAFETEKREDDYLFKKIVENDNKQQYEVEVLVDAMSFLYLQDAEVDYQEDLQNSQFVIRNPNAQTTCGCGSSFSA